MRSPIPRIVGIHFSSSCLNPYFVGDVSQGEGPIPVESLTAYSVLAPIALSVDVDNLALHRGPSPRQIKGGLSMQIPTRITPVRSNDREIAMFSNCLP